MNEPSVTARVVRFNVAKIRLGQTLIPLAMIASVATRYFPGPLAISVAVALQISALGAFVLARRSWGRRLVRIVSGKFQFHDNEKPIVPTQIGDWTLAGSIARLYGADVSWKLTSTAQDQEALGATLARLLGKPRNLRPRGSRGARRVALAVLVLGLGLTAVAVGLDVMPLFPLGLVSIVMGGAFLGALSQKIVAPPTDARATPKRPG